MSWSWSNGEPGNWTFEVDELTDLGVRHDPKATGLPDGLVASRKVYDWRGPQLQPLPRLAQPTIELPFIDRRIRLDLARLCLTCQHGKRHRPPPEGRRYMSTRHFLHLSKGNRKMLTKTVPKTLDYDSGKCDSQIA